MKQWPDGYALAQKASNRLEEVLGKSADIVSAEWGLTVDDRGRQVFQLQLNDPANRSERQIDPDALRSSALTGFHMHRAWGDLLRARNERHLKDIIGEEG